VAEIQEVGVGGRLEETGDPVVVLVAFLRLEEVRLKRLDTEIRVERLYFRQGVVAVGREELGSTLTITASKPLGVLVYLIKYQALR
jgi:hypothetical protein